MKKLRSGNWRETWTDTNEQDWEILKNTKNSWGLYAILGNPQIFSAMAMAMSIHRTLCVLVSPENFTPRDVPSQQIRKPLLRADFNFLSPPLFFLKISLLEMLIAFGNEHLKRPRPFFCKEASVRPIDAVILRRDQSWKNLDAHCQKQWASLGVKF